MAEHINVSDVDFRVPCSYTPMSPSLSPDHVVENMIRRTVRSQGEREVGFLPIGADYCIPRSAIKIGTVEVTPVPGGLWCARHVFYGGVAHVQTMIVPEEASGLAEAKRRGWEAKRIDAILYDALADTFDRVLDLQFGSAD